VAPGVASASGEHSAHDDAAAAKQRPPPRARNFEELEPGAAQLGRINLKPRAGVTLGQGKGEVVAPLYLAASATESA
jgi:hypothetical protein